MLDPPKLHPSTFLKNPSNIGSRTTKLFLQVIKHSQTWIDYKIFKITHTTKSKYQRNDTQNILPPKYQSLFKKQHPQTLIDNNKDLKLTQTTKSKDQSKRNDTHKILSPKNQSLQRNIHKHVLCIIKRSRFNSKDCTFNETFTKNSICCSFVSCFFRKWEKYMLITNEN